MGVAETLDTEFAPAERASWGDVRRQAAYFSGTNLPRELLDAVPDLVAVVNRERQIVYVNEAFWEALEVEDGASVIGLRPGEVLHCEHSSETEGGCGTTAFCRTCGAVKAILISQRGARSAQECRITQTQDVGGGSLDLRVWATPFWFRDELFTIFAIVDIGDEKRRRALERIFFHDILNTAGLLSGAVEMLDDATPEEAEKLQGYAYRAVSKLIEEIQGQKELLRAENNELVVRPTEMGSLDLLWQIADLYAEHRVAKDRNIRVASSAEDVGMVTDPTLLGRVIGNMTKNALEASPPGADVTLGCEVSGNEVQFWVHNATFMPRDVQLQVFQRSFSTKGPGRGLGTYGMKLLSERYLQGSVSFTTSREAGTTFWARYPLRLEAGSQEGG